MKKYLVIFFTLAIVACNNSKVSDNAYNDSLVRQRVIDSMTTVNAEKSEMDQRNANSSKNNNSVSTNNNTSTVNDNKVNAPVKKKGMSNTTKGALIGTGAGILVGAATGAATSENKGKGAVVGGIIGGAVGSGVGYGIGAKTDKNFRETIQ